MWQAIAGALVAILAVAGAWAFRARRRINGLTAEAEDLARARVEDARELARLRLQGAATKAEASQQAAADAAQQHAKEKADAFDLSSYINSGRPGR